MTNTPDGYDTPDPLDFGEGVTGRFMSWGPNRDLNPQYADVPDVERWGLLLTHRKPNGELCTGGVTFDGPVQRQLEPGRPRWTVESMDPLTLSPSIRCDCGLHGFIREGRWVNA